MKISSKFQSLILLIASIFALAGFGWPLLLGALPNEAEAAVPAMATVLVIAMLVIVALVFDGDLIGPKKLALIGVLGGFAAATRVATGGVGGFELVFLFVILGGRAFGAKFGFLLGLVAILSSSLFFGGVGPWTAFQAFAVGWVGYGAGRLPRNLSRKLEVFCLALYAAGSSYVFGLIMNLWFWPFAVCVNSTVSYSAQNDLGTNLSNFLVYSLLSSTLTWDTVRAVTLAVAIILIGSPALAVFRRFKL